ncbi:SDR family NAD(P)-dependent oxidoreductase [Novispirillum sp. DQ9]|uniref:SDR family NAD(P)-dependent oxidoreductase n=1 Tax=Novispirillum sp. DQ9 TaxID=3398612 RepID=UPI003C7C4BD5
MEIQGLTAIVTGGASGLGAATARLLAGRGARVGVLDLNGAAAEALGKELGGIGLACDVTNPAHAEQALGAVREALGPERVLVNCAGIGVAKRMVGRDGPMPLEEFDRVIRINLIGSFNMMRLSAAAMGTLAPLPTGERGVVVMTASVAAYEGQIGQTAYAASKAGIVGLTLPAARELAGQGIRVMTIAPGLFETPLLNEVPEAARPALAASIPLGRLGHPQEFAALAEACITNPFLSGEVIRLDGAMRLAPR